MTTINPGEVISFTVRLTHGREQGMSWIGEVLAEGFVETTVHEPTEPAGEREAVVASMFPFTPPVIVNRDRLREEASKLGRME